MTITTLAQLVAQTESNNDPWAVRFEPAYSPNGNVVLQMTQHCHCSMETARVLCAMSWGAFQIMGDELLKLGWNKTPFEFLADPAAQLDMFDKYMMVDHLGTFTLDDFLNNESQRLLFAGLYNGPGNYRAYADRMLQIYKDHAA